MNEFVKKIIIYSLMTVIGWIFLIFLAANSFDSWQSFFHKYTNIPIRLGKAGDSSAIRFKEIENYSNIDVLFIGSSHCYRAFDPRIFKANGYETFNMGSTAQSFLNSYFLLDEHLDRLNPKLVVIETYSRLLGNDGLESFIDIALNVPKLNALFDMAFATDNFKAINYHLAYKMSFDKPSTELALHSSDLYIAGGYVEKALDFKEEWVFDTMAVAVNQNQIEYLRQIVIMLAKRNIKVVLIEQPIPQQLQAATLNLSEVRELLSKVASEYDVPYIDFNELVALDEDEHFFDYHHLNQTGVEIFNMRLIEVLRNRQIIR